MKTRMVKNLVTVLLGIVLSMGGLVWISGKAANKTELATAQMIPETLDSSQPVADERASTATQDANNPVTEPVANNESYSAGYRDGWRDASEPRSTSAVQSRVRYSGPTHSARRSKVAGVTYSRNRRGHSTRNAILTVAAPAALGAGVGAIAGGKRGAGAGALVGGGAGALYYLFKHKR